MADVSEHKETCADRLWQTEDVMKYTGRKKTYVCNLAKTGKIPFIPGRPNLFVPEEVKKAFLELQQGGKYGKAKRRKAA